MNGPDGNTGHDLRERIHLLQVSLHRIGAGNPRLEAELLICAALGWNRVELLSRSEEAFTPGQERRIEELLDRRLCGEPIAYVLGNADFMGLHLEVGPGVLIPRSETEALVEVVEEELSAGAGDDRGTLRLLDVGTGSGAILIALAARNPRVGGVGLDISDAALAYARRNAEAHGLGDRLKLELSDGFAALGDASRSAPFDAVISNPPYISTGDLADLPREIREHEPVTALDGGPKGLDALKALVEGAWRWLGPGGLLALELSPEQAMPLRAWAEAQGAYESVRIRKDLARRDRFLTARRRAGSPTS